MKIKSLITLGVFCMLLGSNAISGCGYSAYNQSCGADSEFDNKCQCTDPACYRSYDRDCSSMTTCCEAFGNVGAR